MLALLALFFGVIAAGLRSCAMQQRDLESEQVSKQKEETEPLAAKTYIEGAVFDSKARPLSGATVDVFCAGPVGLRALGRTETNEEGKYVFEVCDSGMVHVLIRKKGYERSHLVRRIPSPAPGKERMFSLENVHLQVGVVIAGSVADSRGFPIQGVLVAAVPQFDIGEKMTEEVPLQEEDDSVGDDESPRTEDQERDEERDEERDIARRGMDAVSFSWPYTALTDREGRFEITGLPPGRYRVQFQARGYLDTVREDQHAPGPWMDVALESLRGINGKVVFGGAPVNGAQVHVAGSGLWPARRVWTDAEGNFRFPDIPPGVYEIRAEKDDLASRVILGLEVEEGVDLEFLTLTLEEGVRVRFHVKNQVTGKPLHGVRVMLGHGALTVGARAGRTDEKGMIEFPGVLKGMYFVSAERFGFLPHVSRPVRVGGEPPEDEDSGDFHPDDADESMVDGADLRDGDAGSSPDDREDGLARVQNETIEMQPGAEIAGEVVNDVGDVVEGARLEIISSSPGVRGGRFSAGVFDAQEMLFQMALAESSPGGAPVHGTGGVEVPAVLMEPAGADIPEKGGFMSLGVTGGPVPPTPLSGGWHVEGLDDSGSWAAPADGPAHLHMEAGTYITDAKGRFRIAGLAAGDVVVMISHPEYARFQSRPMRLRLNRKQDGLRFVLSPGIKLLGTVLDEINKPLQGVRVVASGARDAYHGAVAVSDRKGEFRLDHLSGKVRLHLTSQGYVSLVTTVDMDDIGRAQREKRLKVTLEEASQRMSGFVVDKRDLPVEEAAVEIISLDPRSPQRLVTRTGENGDFEFEGLGKLDYLLRLYHSDRPDVEYRGLELNRSHRLVMGYGGGIQGWVRDRSTKGYVTHLTLELKPRVGASLERSFLSGRFDWTGLEAGVYEITAQAPGYTPLKERIRIPEGDSPRQITLKDLEWWMDVSGSLEGIVRDYRMFPVEGAEVWCEGRGFPGMETAVQTGRKGEFALDDLPPGRCLLHARHPDKGQARMAGVKVESGRSADIVLELVPNESEAGAKAPRAGVGITLSARGESILISSIKPRSAAASAGLARGDELTAIDGGSLDGLGLSLIETSLQGPAGTTVILTVSRRGKTFDIPVQREILD